MRIHHVGLLTSAVLLGAVAILASCYPGSPLADRPECPHDWSTVFRPTATRREGKNQMTNWIVPGPPEEFLISEHITNIPEFHDCQKLMPSAVGATGYGELAAVFARDSIDYVVSQVVLPQSVSQGQLALEPLVRPATFARVSGPAPTGAQGPALVALAEIASEGAYEALGIGEGFNCLLMDYSGPRLQARMLAMGTTHKGFTCVDFESEKPPAGTPVRILSVQLTESRTVPPVARWEWDQRVARQLLGVKCAPDRWCVVGPGDMEPVPNRGAASAQRGLSAQGWYDEQFLAEPGNNGTLAPSGNFATIIPDEELDRFDSPTPPRGEWIRAAHVALPKHSNTYQSKLGFRRTAVAFPTSSLHGLNLLELCIGTMAECHLLPSELQVSESSSCSKAYLDAIEADPVRFPPDSIVWARVTPPPLVSDTTPDVRYHCVTYRTHPGVKIPKVVRWRWKAEDETIWTFCPVGCCEVHSSPLM